MFDQFAQIPLIFWLTYIGVMAFAFCIAGALAMVNLIDEKNRHIYNLKSIVAYHEGKLPSRKNGKFCKRK